MQDIQIEGLGPDTLVESNFSDVDPGAIITRFHVESEIMPYLSDVEGREVRQNFVYVTRIFELGRSSYTRRIRDKVTFDETTNKWRIIKMAPGDRSDINRNRLEWNAFVRGAVAEPVGVPLRVLFKNDPSRVAMYEAKHIKTIEQLASLTFSDQQSLGLGVVDDASRARSYLDKIRAQAPSIEVNNKLEEKDRQISQLQLHLSELNAKLNELLTNQIETSQQPKKASKPKDERE